jgi:hypothetical protein
MMLAANKACPVVLRHKNGVIEILAFEHPLAGSQLIKGTIEPGENFLEAALRELAEEAGIVRAQVGKTLGIWQSGYQQQIWVFVECIPQQALAGTWVHRAPDDGGNTSASSGIRCMGRSTLHSGTRSFAAHCGSFRTRRCG